MNGKRIGLSYWGFCEDFNECNVAETPDGVRFNRPMLVDEFVRRGHRVLAMQQQREVAGYCGLERRGSDANVSAVPTMQGKLAFGSTPYSGYFPELDILFIEWRWPTWKNSGMHPIEYDWRRQCDMLNEYCGKIPVVVWDADFKIRPEDERRWPEMIIADPALKPRTLTRDRVVLPFYSDWRMLFGDKPIDYSYNYTYVGNNYERDAYIKRYYAEPAGQLRVQGIQTAVWGNWLNRSPERVDPSTAIMRYPFLAFQGRVGFKDSMIAVRKAICVTHIQKESYFKQGLITPRFHETLACGTPALVPAECYIPDILGKRWTVSNSSDVIKAVTLIAGLTPDDRKALVEEQLEQFKKHMPYDVASTVDYFESLL
jgi:hypothetical protein